MEITESATGTGPLKRSTQRKTAELESMCKRKVLTRASIWYMCQQFPLEESSFKRDFLFAMEISQIVCYFGFIVFLCRMFSGFYGILDTIKSNKHARKKYGRAKMANKLAYFYCKKKNSFN